MNKKPVDHILYLTNDSLLTNSEKKFYLVLIDLLPGAYLLFSKVRIPDIVHIPEWYKPYHWSVYWWNRIKAKHVDFLICDKATFTPLLVVEIDDPSHETPRGKKRDGLVNFVFRKANLPILHLTDKSLENLQELRECIYSNLDRN